MIYTHIAAGLVAAVIAAAGTWQVQSWRYGTQIAQMQTQEAKERARATDRALTETIELQRKKDAAIKSAEKRARASESARLAAVAESDGLRNELSESRSQIAGASCASVRNYASTVTELLESCSRQYLDMAGKAQGHAADSLMYQEAWPSK